MALRAASGLAALFLLAGCAPAPAPPPVHASDEDDSEPAVAGREGDEPALPSLGAASPPATAGAALLAEVHRQLEHMKVSVYSHTTAVDEASGSYAYDCSGMLGYALSRASPDALSAVLETSKRRPRSAEFVAFLRSLPPGAARGRWQSLARVDQLAPGDVVAWLKPPSSPSTNTGHTMVVAGAVVPQDGHPGAFVVPVADSTGHRHGPGDSRAPGATGLGRGDVVLETDADGAPVRYRWSRAETSPAKATTIALGRLR